MLLQRYWSIVALAAAASMTLPTFVWAQPASQQVGQDIAAFSVTQVDQLRPGEVLAFRLEGQPEARVSVQISGATATLLLTETSPGRYEGEYTIRLRDKLTAASIATAKLEKSGQVATATLGQPLQQGAGASASSPISSFHVSAPAQVQPGDELIFALHGMHGGQASASVRGIAQRVLLTEVRPGTYEAAYVVRRKDALRGSLVADGHLVINKREATLRYEAEQHGGHGSSQPVVSCGHCGRVTGVSLVTVKSDHPNIIGSIAGGVLGGVLGHQVGGGRGRDLATIAGALGGAYAGNRVENNMNKKQVYRVSVRLDNGTTRSFDYAEDPELRTGTRVKVADNALSRA
jgi:outer membrane lipoprotein SlyB